MTGQNLAEKYRPTSFEDFKGSELLVDMIRTMVERRSLPSAMLFTGDKGVGKTSMCRIINRGLNGEDSSLSYIEVDAASNSGVDNIRSLQEAIRYSHPGEWRIVVLDEAHNLSNAAFNSLLKVLEDPPPKTTFILVTTRPESIPDTVKSRSMIFRFQNPGVRTVLERLVEVYREEGMEFEPRVLARIAQVSEGTLRGALVLLQQVLFVPNPTVETVNILSGFTVSTKDLLYAMLEGKLSGVERELSSMFADSGDVEKFLLSLAEVIKEFYTAGMLSTSKFLNCMKVIWSMRKIQGSSDMVARTQLEAGLFAMFLENFWDGSDEVEESGGQPVSMEDLQEFT